MATNLNKVAWLYGDGCCPLGSIRYDAEFKSDRAVAYGWQPIDHNGTPCPGVPINQELETFGTLTRTFDRSSSHGEDSGSRLTVTVFETTPKAKLDSDFTPVTTTDSTTNTNSGDFEYLSPDPSTYSCGYAVRNRYASASQSHNEEDDGHEDSHTYNETETYSYSDKVSWSDLESLLSFSQMPWTYYGTYSSQIIIASYHLREGRSYGGVPQDAPYSATRYKLRIRIEFPAGTSESWREIKYHKVTHFYEPYSNDLDLNTSPTIGPAQRQEFNRLPGSSYSGWVELDEAGPGEQLSYYIVAYRAHHSSAWKETGTKLPS